MKGVGVGPKRGKSRVVVVRQRNSARVHHTMRCDSARQRARCRVRMHRTSRNPTVPNLLAVQQHSFLGLNLINHSTAVSIIRTNVAQQLCIQIILLLQNVGVVRHKTTHGVVGVLPADEESRRLTRRHAFQITGIQPPSTTRPGVVQIPQVVLPRLVKPTNDCNDQGRWCSSQIRYQANSASQNQHGLSAQKRFLSGWPEGTPARRK